MDETYVKVNSREAYRYRAVDNRGRTIDFNLSPRRNSKATCRFLNKILNKREEMAEPADKAPYGRACWDLNP